MGRLLRGTFKLAVVGAVIAGIAAVAKKLMGGLGPTPGSPEAPREWPSLVPDPATETAGTAQPEPEPEPAASNNGAEPLVTSVPGPTPAGADPAVTDPAVTDPETDPTA